MKKTILIVALVALAAAAILGGIVDSMGWGGLAILGVILVICAGSGLFGDTAQKVTFVGALLVAAFGVFFVTSKEGGDAWRKYEASHPTQTAVPAVCAGIQPVQVNPGQSFVAPKNQISIAVSSNGTSFFGQELAPKVEFWPTTTVLVTVYPAACRTQVDTIEIPRMKAEGVFFAFGSAPTAIPTQMLEPTLTPTVP